MTNNTPTPDPIAPWQPGKEQLLASTRILTVRQRHWRSPTNPRRAGEFVYLDCPAWVNVIAITPDDDVVLIEQFRHGLGRVTLEIPGGMIDPGEDPSPACARELEEETGYRAPAVDIIGRVSANPAIQNNWCYTGLARDARPVGGQSLDEHEEIAVRLVPLRRIKQMLRDGRIHHSLVVAAFTHLILHTP